MSLRPNELAQVIDELELSLVGAFVQKVHAPLPRLCFLELRQPGRSVRLCLSAEPNFARVSVAASRLPSPEVPPPFQKWLRQELIGARLSKAQLLADRHTAKLTFERAEHVRHLAAELRGTGANLFLLDAQDRILAAAVSEGERTRPGATWSPPAVDEAGADDEPSRLKPDPTAAFPYAEAAEALFGVREHARRAQDIRKRLTGPLKAKLQRIERTREKVRAEAARTDDAERHRALGELLMQNLHQVTRGAKSVRLTRWTEAGAEEVEVPLDPQRTPKEEAEWHFHQYKRLLRGSEHAARRLEELSREADEVRRELEALQARAEEELLEEIDLLAQPKRKGPERGKPYKVFTSITGARVLVGRSSEGNDELTFRIARPFDLWLHARGVPGSHVILECAKNAEVPREALIDAALLAHHHSQLKGEPRGEIAYTQVKFVKKVKGGAPGQVLYTRDKSLVVRVEPERLERLLRSRDASS